MLCTFFDLYALGTDFPAFEEAKKKLDVYSRVTCLEQGMNQAISGYVQCRPERFMPHIQPYEFEGLLFSDVASVEHPGADLDQEPGHPDEDTRLSRYT
jgi:hypothetical protein